MFMYFRSLLRSALLLLQLLAVGADFRAVSWEMSVEEVKAAEETEPIAEIGYDGTEEFRMVYRDSLFGVEVELRYWFYEGKLKRATYSFREVMEKEKAEEVYAHARLALSEKYGAATEVRITDLKSASHTWELEHTRVSLNANYLMEPLVFHISYWGERVPLAMRRGQASLEDLGKL